MWGGGWIMHLQIDGYRETDRYTDSFTFKNKDFYIFVYNVPFNLEIRPK